MRVESTGGKDVIAVEVKEADEKPVLFKGRAYKRVGRSSHKISAGEIRRLSVETKKVYWDGQVCEEAGLDDIDWGFVKDDFIPLYEGRPKGKFPGSRKRF